MIHISHQTKQIVASYSPALAALFPHGRQLAFEGEQVIVVPYGVDETKCLRNLGYAELPSPIEEIYDFPSADRVKPFAKQVLTCASMIMNPRSFVLNGMGTGKTKSCLWAFDFLRKELLATTMLVVAPLSTLRFTWEREIFHTFPEWKVQILRGSADKRKKLLAEPADVYIINHHGLATIQKEIIGRLDIDVMCFDEAAAYRNSRTDLCKVASKIANLRPYVWGMTGSPTPSAPTDCIGLARLVMPEKAPRSFTHFRQETMLQVSQFKWVPKKTAAETVAQVLQPAVRFALQEIVELPPVIEREMQVEMGERQRATYLMLKEHAAVQLREGTITAVNGGVLYSKLLQTSIGWVYGNDGKTYELDNGERIKALIDLIHSVEAKVIVFSPYIHTMEGVSAALKKAGIDFATVSGATPDKQRSDIFTAFQNTDRYKVLSAHPQCMSHGITLTAADTVIWFGPITKYEIYEQANARIRRIGQTKKQQIIHFVASATERQAYARLRTRQSLQDHVLELLAEITEAGNE
jgi:SNF2 family DNA or RNA helicase